MIRHRSFVFALAAATLLTATPASAATLPSAASAFRHHVVQGSSTPRAVTASLKYPYVVVWVSSSGIRSQGYATLAEARTQLNLGKDAQLINAQTGQVLSSNERNPYEGTVVSLPGMPSSPLQGTTYASIAAAVKALAGVPEALVTNRLTGAVVWSDADNYAVSVPGSNSVTYDALADALAAAQKDPAATVTVLASDQPIWQAAYDVRVGNEFVESFPTMASATAFATAHSDGEVLDVATQKVVFTTAVTYGVYRYLQLVRTFTSQSDALSYAKSLDHVQVVDSGTRAVIYSNYPTQVQSPYGDTFTVQHGDVVDTWGNEVFVLAPAPGFMKPGKTYVSNDYDHWYEVQPGADVYVGQWENPYQTLNLETRSNLTAAQINAFLAQNAVSSSVMQGMGQVFIQAQDTYGVNAEYLVAHAIIESAWGTSYFAQYRNNMYGYEAYTSDPNAAASFRSIAYDINFQAWFVRNDYLNPAGSFYNGPNLDGMNVDYATDPWWANSIARRMAQMETYSAALADEPILPESPDRQVFPYPAGGKGKTTAATPLLSFPADTTSMSPKTITTIAPSVIVSVYGDAPGWDWVKTSDGLSGFVNWNDISLQNLLEVTGISYGETLNVRSTPSAASDANIVDRVPDNVYLVLISRGPGGWDKIADGNGKTGYVSDAYVEVIH